MGTFRLALPVLTFLDDESALFFAMLSPKSPTGMTMVGFGNKREDVLRAKGGFPHDDQSGKKSSNQPLRVLSFDQTKSGLNKSKMKSDWQEVQKALQTDGVEGAVHNIKQIAFKRAKKRRPAEEVRTPTARSVKTEPRQKAAEERERDGKRERDADTECNSNNNTKCQLKFFRAV